MGSTEGQDGASPDETPVGVLWTWTPEVADSVAYDEPATPLASLAPPLDLDEVTPVPASADVGVLWDWVPDPEAPERTELVEPTVVRPLFKLDPDLVLAPPALLPAPIFADAVDDEHWAGVARAHRRRRRTRIAVGSALVLACAVLPWAAPQVPDLFADAVPAKATPTVPDPTIEPPAPLPSRTATSNPLEGKRLASAGKPLEVVVPRLHVRSEVVPISGQTGELVPPDDPQLLGWWQEGRGVGVAAGSSVVTGHTVSTGGGAFDHLGKLVVGDKVKVRTSRGTIEYVVTASKNYSVARLAARSASIFRQDGPGRLVLITCSDFDGRVYRSNAVVYAEPVAERPLNS
ncbi:class F sortase [Marmoricola sp. OAE513]|uniref:class F sortase n=1 Tax=Marmoricola sp. OAE513 TaxID=2817894 RepID=UPI001D904332